MNRIVIGTSAAIAVSSAAFLLGYIYFAQRDPGSERIRYWKAQIVSLGAERAYAQLSCSFQDQPDQVGHEEGHAFGAALAIEEGMSGLSICDDQFQYACLHEFTGQLIHERGVTILPQFSTYCEQNTDPHSLCEHGIGHGILAYFGYGKSDASRATEMCREYSRDGFAAGKCISGVFMEYLDRTMLGPNKSYEMDFSDPYEPCTGFEESDFLQCALELPRAWRKTLVADGVTKAADIIARSSDYCLALANTDAQASCLRGLGYESYRLSHGSLPAATNLCLGIPKEYVQQCIDGAAHMDGFDNVDKRRCEISTTP